jgi:fibronectin type 3 domain-containing protein
MKKYTKHLRETIVIQVEENTNENAHASWMSGLLQVVQLRCILFMIVLLAASGLAHAASQNPNHVEITSIVPLEPGSSDVRITWEGGIAPYKVQVKDEITATWRDATFHIYANSYVISNSLPGAFYRVRTIPDTTPPSSMRGFGPRQVDCNAVRFTWDAASCSSPLCGDNQGGSGLRGYKIYRDGALLMEVGFPTNAVVDTTVSGGTTYQYWAAAIDLAGNESPRSGTRVVETPTCDPQPPDQHVTLAWDANPEPDIAGYILHYGRSSGSYTETMDVGKVTTNSVAELVSGATYYFVVTAYNGEGLEGDASNEVSYSVP